MKNQYFGDIGDYGKYSLLRAFANEGISIGVNWYLTENDGSTDGKHTKYLDDPREERYDPELFACLKEMVDANKRSIETFEMKGMIPEATYYHQLLDISKWTGIKEKRVVRKAWHEKALLQLQDAELVFLDPDNGMTDNDTSTRKDSVKYAFASEAAEYYKRGQNIVYYCHKGRRTWEQWDDAKKILCKEIPDAVFTAVTFRRGTQRTFIFAIHKVAYPKYHRILKTFLDGKWSRYFRTEPVNNVDSNLLTTGEKLVLELRNNEAMTVEKTVGGDVSIRFSGTPNQTLILDAEHFASHFRR